jgi:transposase InsO family protein
LSSTGCPQLPCLSNNPDNIIPKRSPPPKPIYLFFTINGEEVRGLLDTGSVYSSIPSRLLPVNTKVSPWTSSPLVLAEGSQTTPLGDVNLKINVNGKDDRFPFAVFKDSPFGLILGLDFMRHFRIRIDPITGTYKFVPNSVVSSIKLDSVAVVSDSESLSLPLAADNFMCALQSLESDQKSKIEKLIAHFPQVFAQAIGHTSVVEHEIRLSRDAPKIQRPYPTSPLKQQEINRQIDELIDLGLLVPSKSPYASPIFTVPKEKGKFGEWRLVCDFRYINTLTVNDAQPFRKIDNILSKLKGCKFISKIDLKSGFHQVKVAEGSRHLTAIHTHRGLMEWVSMPYGLKTAPATFITLMNKVLEGIIDDFCWVYLDDIIVVSDSFDEHLDHLNKVFQRLSSAGLVVNSRKCSFGVTQIKFLGHQVSEKGLEKDSEATDFIQMYPRPKSVKDIRKFLGAAGWYRKFVHMYSDLVEPLVALLRKGTKFKWGEAQETAFRDIKEAMRQDLLLAHPDFSKPFILRTDASKVGMGACLSQITKKGEHIIACRSKTFKSAQRSYSTVAREAFALVWALDKFRDYLDGQEFVLETDHRALTWLHKFRNSSQHLMSWALRVQAWSPNIQYIQGKRNTFSDWLSRIIPDPEQEVPFTPAALLLTCDLDKGEIRDEQQKDSHILNLFHNPPENYAVAHDILYKRVAKKLVPVIPSSLYKKVAQIFHDHPISGHLGVDRTHKRLKSHAFWPGMRKYVQNYIKTCDICQKCKPSNTKPPGLMKSSCHERPWDTVYLDLMGPYVKSAPGRFEYILVVVDAFTRFVFLFPLRCATSNAISVILENEIFCTFGMPKAIVTDNATNLKSATIEYLCKQWNVKHHFTTVYHPQSNITERHNRNIKIMIRSYVMDIAHKKWSQNLKLFQLALNSAVCQTTGFTPSQLFLNREFNLPFDNALQPTPEEIQELTQNSTPEDNLNDFLFDRTDTYSKILEMVKSNIKNAQEHQKKFYDGHHRHDTFKVGDLVLIRSITKSSKRDGVVAGFAPPFERGPAVVTKVLSDLNYEVLLNGETLGPFHIQFLRRYNQRDTQTPSTSNTQNPNVNDDSFIDPHNLQLFDPGELPMSDDEDEIRSIPDPIINPPSINSSPSSPVPSQAPRTYNLRPRAKVDYKALHTGKRK